MVAYLSLTFRFAWRNAYNLQEIKVKNITFGSTASVPRNVNREQRGYLARGSTPRRGQVLSACACFGKDSLVFLLTRRILSLGRANLDGLRIGHLGCASWLALFAVEARATVYIVTDDAMILALAPFNLLGRWEPIVPTRGLTSSATDTAAGATTASTIVL